MEAGKETYEKTRDDAEALLKHAVANGMGTSVQLLLRGAVDKVKRSLLELEAKQATESKAAETKDEGPPSNAHERVRRRPRPQVHVRQAQESQRDEAHDRG